MGEKNSTQRSLKISNCPEKKGMCLAKASRHSLERAGGEGKRQSDGKKGGHSRRFDFGRRQKKGGSEPRVDRQGKKNQIQGGSGRKQHVGIAAKKKKAPDTGVGER